MLKFYGERSSMAEPRVVVPVVVGSSPIAHPIILTPNPLVVNNGPLAQLVEQLTLNQRVVGSKPTRPTMRDPGGGLFYLGQ